MAELTSARSAPRRGWPDKRQAIIRAALTGFGRDGYTRASIESIAAAAAVSTRTIYNHFTDKEHLFRSVIEQSATEVADAQITLIQRHLDRVADFEAGLTALACVWTVSADFADHFALVRQINAESGHISQPTLDRWQEVGPRRVRRELALRLEHAAARGLLAIDDADQAALHFVLLVASEITTRTNYGAVPLRAAERKRIATAGVRVFLHGYLPPGE